MEKLDPKRIENILALTPVQEGILFHYLKNPGSDYYFEQLSLDISGEIDVECFEKAWNTIIQTNEMLRTVFRWEKLEKPSQIILKKHQCNVITYDLSDKNVSQKKTALEEIKNKDRCEIFDLHQVPFRVILCKIDEKKYEMIISNHHILYDGWSTGVILKEFFKAYHALCCRTLSLKPPTKPPFKEFLKWIQNQDRNKQEQFWREYLAGVDTPTALPIKSRKDETKRVAFYSFFLQENIKDMLDAFVKNNRVTLAAIFYGAWGILLQKYCGSEDVIMGTTMSGRSAQVNGIEEMVGLFINTIPLRIKSHPGEKISDVVFRTDNVLRALEEFENTPLTDIQGYRRATGAGASGESLFDTIIALENYPLDNRLLPADSVLSINSYAMMEMTDYDLTVGIIPFNTVNEIEVKFTFHRDVLPEEIIINLAGHFKGIIQNIIENPETSLSQLDIISSEEKTRLLYDFNNTAVEYPAGKTIYQLFEEQASRTPDRIALVGQVGLVRPVRPVRPVFLSYLQLNEQSDRLAGLLIEKGVQANDIVGVMVERSIEMIMAILAVLKAGGAYLPIDPGYPQERIQFMLDDAGVKVLLVGNSTLEKHSFIALQGLEFDESETVCHVTAPRPQIIDLDARPMVNRAVVNYDNYSQYIGLAMVKQAIAIQATRGCPYHCAYCHKIWPKKHVRRSAEDVFNEVQLYYRMGVRRFAFIDDIFNLNVENSSKFFQLIIDNGLEVQFFFPNGMRGDILTRDYIDLMVKAGTVDIALALETASPRLQKLIGKNLDIEKLRENLEYICEKYPHVILELFTMHGFPTETEAEARQTLEFTKSLKWLHFPYFFILKIYPSTDMAALAQENGIPAKTIIRSANLAYHQLPETLPFEKGFTIQLQADFLEWYFLSRERLLHVLPYQMKILTEDELVQKYNSYLPIEIKTFHDLLEFAGIKETELDLTELSIRNPMKEPVPDLDRRIKETFASPVQVASPDANALRILLLDLSQFFSKDSGNMLYDVVEPPLGLMYLATALNQELGNKIVVNIAKSRIDFDDYDALTELLEEFKPNIIGLRTLTYFHDFFHQTAAVIRRWDSRVPIVTGGPYATSDYATLLKDKHIDLAVLGEGEVTFCQLIAKILENNGKLPAESVLQEIPGIAFMPRTALHAHRFAREIIPVEEHEPAPSTLTLAYRVNPAELAYIIYTSGSTGRPKGVMVKQKGFLNLLHWYINEFGIKEDDNVLLIAPVSFDLAQKNLFSPYMAGARLTLATPGIPDYHELSEFIRDEKITIINCAPSVFYPLIEFNGGSGFNRLKSLRLVILGGEPIQADKLLPWVSSASYRCEIINTYGPTEGTDITSFYRIPRETFRLQKVIPIGKPISNVKVYILDKYLRILPVRISGELCIGGISLAKGYHNNIQLTQERFFAAPHLPEKKVYRTGDIARWLQDGNIEFLRRIDQQVKIRGIRIELGEIENKLSKHETIKEAVVLSRQDETGDNYLCAYIVPNNEFVIAELQEYLAKELPDYMIPAYFMTLEKIPLTSSGKVDRKALSKPELKAGESYTAPRDDIETKLVEIWSEVLGREVLPTSQLQKSIGIDDNFFQLGGHSLKATILVSKIHKEFDVRLPLVEIFKTPTIRGLSIYIKHAAQLEYKQVESAEKEEYYVLSSAQKRLYFLQQLDKDGTAYNISSAWILEGVLDRNRLEDTFVRLVKRHESFRTSFDIMGDNPVQRVHDDVEFEIEYYDQAMDERCSGQKQTFLATEDKRTKVEAALKAFIRPFALSQAPLLRVRLERLEESRNLVMVNMHHIISDGTSMGILVKEFMALYESKELPALKVSYKDYAEWQTSEKNRQSLIAQEKFWVGQFVEELPVLNLPTDYPRPLVQGFEGNHASFELTVEETSSLKTLALERGVTLYMLLLAICNTWFSKLSGEEDIIIGTPVAGRRHIEYQNIVGMFVNTLALRNYPAAGRAFDDFLMEIKQRTLEAYQNQDYPFEELVDRMVKNRDTSRNPIFDVMFVFQNMDTPGIEIPGLVLKPYEFENYTSKFDLNLDGMERDGRVFFSLEYSTKLFKDETARRFCEYFKNIVNSITGNPCVGIADIEIMGKEEKEKILEISNGIGEYIDPNITIHGMFEKVVVRNKDKTALVFGESRITYGELSRGADFLARVLRSRGVGRDHTVGLMVERSFDTVIGMLAIMKAGGAYLPIDPKLPGQRKRFMAEDSRMTTLLTNFEIDRDVDYIPGNIPVLNMRGSSIYRDIPMDGEELSNINNGSDLVYVIFTSGSTGMPKGVMLEHINLVNLIKFHHKYTGIDCTKVLQFATISFDASFHEIFSALLAGGELYLVEEETRNNMPVLFEYIAKNKVKTLFLPMAILKLIFSHDEYIDIFPGSVAHIQTAGEQVIVDDRLGNYLKKAKTCLHNHYGPSETHVVTVLTLDPREDIPEFPAIGKPVMNTGIYILNKEKHLLPIGVAGELYAGGLPVGRGYLNNPELTAEKFIAHKLHELTRKKACPQLTQIDTDFSCSFPTISPLTTHHSPIYKTGDLARWLPNGDVEFIGRIDHQVKIRGIRVEPEEIESHLKKIEFVKDAIVIVRQDAKGEKYLCAYIVPDTAHESDISKLRNMLSANLPDYLIPRYFVPMEKIPLTPSGKVDRKVLPEPDIISGKDYTAPRNRSEQVLVKIWAETLGIEEGKIGIDTNFFQVGGHSLKAILLISRVHREFNTKIPLVEIFKRPNIRGLAEFVSSKAKERYVSIEAVESKEFYPLSSAQKRLYFLHQFEPGSTVYNLPVVMELRGLVDISRFENTFRKLIRRHESLRTSFEMVGEKPVQRIHEHVEFKIEYFAADERCPGQTQTFLATEFKDHFIRAFDLSNAPLLRVGLAKIEEEKYIFWVDMHHIISDGMSSQVLVQDFSSLYAGEKLPEIKLQYKEYAEWQNLEKLNKKNQEQGEYWRNEFEGEIPVLELPPDYARPSVQFFEGNSIKFEINKETFDALKVLALETGTTLYIVLLAVYTILLAKLTGREDIVIGTPVAGRWHADLEKIIGIFVNTLALRNYPSGEKRFLDFLGEVKDIALKGFENQEYQYEDLVEDVVATRDVSRNPLFDTMLVLQNFQLKKIEIPGLKLIPYEYENKTSKFDLSLAAMEIEEKLLFMFEYSTKLFKRETIERFIVYFLNIVISIVENKNRGISDLEILAEEEKRRILFDFNDTEAEYPKDKMIHQLFEQQVERIPDRIAVIGSTAVETLRATSLPTPPTSLQITYRQLNEQSNRLAGLLSKKGVLPDTIVGIMVERSVEMIIGIFGILKSGGAYLPIDPGYPQERADYMLNDSGVRLLVTTNDKEGEKVRRWEGENVLLNHLSFHHSSFIIHHSSHSSQLAYLIYTSGSTGKPKGVLIEHHSVINRLNWMQRFYPLGKDDVILQKTPFIFDVSVWELSWWALTGASVFLLEPGAEKEPEKLVEAIEKNKITVMHFVPSMLNAFLEYIEGAGDLKKLASLRRVFASGEALGVRQVETFNRLINRGNAAQLVNLYGPTEATVDVSYFNSSVGRDYDAIPIGKPIDNIQLYIFDKRGCLQPMGIAGELCISGVGLARGYLNRCELTAEKFYRSYRSNKTYINYKTGDLARWLPDGNIEFLGRLDNQVKIRGFRIELGELESLLVKHSDIKEAVVLVNETSGGSKYLCAYFVPATPLTVDNIREYLKAYLPSYMVPSYFIRVDRMPLLPNGKIDRLGFPKSGLTAEEDTFSPPTSAEEKILAETWAEVLEVDKVGIHDNFFALGGDSIRSIVVVSRARARGLNFTTKQLFQYPTINGLLKNINHVEPLNHLPTQKTILQPFSLISSEDYLKIQGDIEDAYPLTMLQAGLIFQSELTHNTSMYHDLLTHKINGRFHRQLFQETVERMVKRHPIFRTTYDLKNYSQYLQLVHKEVPLPLQVEDLTEFPPEHREKLIKAALENERTRRIDWGQPGLIRFFIHILDQNTYQYTFSYHDSALDGWSVSSLNTELYLTYHSLLGEIEYTEKLGLDVSFRDFVALEHQAMASEEVKNYWRKLLTGSTFTELPRWPLEPAVNATERVIFNHVPISQFLSQQIKELAKTLGVPIKSVLMAAHCRVLGVLCGNSDILTGYEHSGRPEESDGEKILGLFLNSIPFRLKMPGGTWADIIRAAYNAEIEFLPYRRYPMALMKQERKGEPLFEVVFNYTHFHVLKKLLQLPNLDLLEMGAMAETEFVLRAEFSQSAFTDNVQLSLHYHSNVFSPEQIEATGRYYTRTLELMCENAHEPYELQSLLPLEEQKQLLEEFNNTTAGYPLDQCFNKLFQANVQHAPGVTAACFEEKCLTYNELDRRANRLARVLIERGIPAEAIVSVIMRRGIPLLTSILAIFKAGGVYLPIDTQYPAERIEGILNQSGCRLVLTENEFIPALSEITNKPSPNNNYELLPVESILHSNSPGNNLPQRCAPHNLAYVIYTSGSTGVPKGVMIEHRGMLNHLYVKKTDLKVTSSDIIAQNASQCFDISIWQLLLALMVGGKTIIYPDDLIMAPARFISGIVKDQATILEVVPSYLSIMLTSLDITFRKYLALKFLLVTGETLKPELVEQWFEKYPHIQMVNAYGPTEASDDITHFIMPKAPLNGQIPIGKPVQNLRIYITDKQMQLCPTGVKGEICVSGVGVGRGYLHDEQRTKEVFIEDPFAGEKGIRLYKTGDLGRWLPDGNIDFFGRKDTQVKIRGFRIELGEIENRLLKHKEIKEAVVIVGDGEEKNEDKYLYAYIVAGREIETSELKDYLSGALPGYMIPQNFVRLEKIPLTSNGKIDKARLPIPTGTAGIRPVYAAPGNSIERKIVKIWSEVLKIDEKTISIHDDFFALGGHSLKALEIMVKSGGEFPIRKIFQYPTPGQLAENIINSKERGDDTLLHRFDKTHENEKENVEVSIICFPYAGGSAVIYKPLADALTQLSNKTKAALYALELPGHNFIEQQIELKSIHEIAHCCALEIKAKIKTPVILWGHCSGTAVTIETAKLLEQEGIDLRTVCLGGRLIDTPFQARIKSIKLSLSSYFGFKTDLTDEEIRDWLINTTGFNEFEGIGESESAFIIRNFRHDAGLANEYFQNSLKSKSPWKLSAAIYNFIAKDDPLTINYEKRYKNWSAYSDTIELITLEGGGHYFAKTRALETARIILDLWKKQLMGS